MKMAMIALAALIVLGGGAAGAYFYLGKPAEAAGGPVDEAAKAEQAKKEAAVKEENLKFVELTPMILPIIDENGVNQVVTIVLAVEVPDDAAADKVRKLSPRLKDAYIQDMYGVLNRKAALEGGVIEVGSLKERLNRVTQEVMGEDTVNDVLLQVVKQEQI